MNTNRTEEISTNNQTDVPTKRAAGENVSKTEMKDRGGASSSDISGYQADSAYLNMDLLRFTTAGSVDDGKSTLIGRLLYDSKSIFEDQWEALETTARSRGDGPVNMALLTDGLRAEREQGITIDVAYRYFATPKRKFIIADTPGHEQYTRNMVTGASTADLAIILIDARKGVLTQSRRHAFLSSLLQIPHLVVAVNKMDLVAYSEERFDNIVDEFKAFSEHLDVDDITFIPISALNGDNIVNGSEHMDWYRGSTLLHHLEHVKVGSRKNPHDFRFPVQYVIRPNQDYRGFAGSIVSGSISTGEEITVLPSGEQARIHSIRDSDGAVDTAGAGMSVVLELDRDIDISRGDMLVRTNNVPNSKTRFEATVSWMNRQELQKDKTYLIMHTTRTTKAFVRDIRYRINVDTFHREQAESLALNEIGRILIETSSPLFFDAYKLNNATGSFVIIDPDSNVTVGAGMIRSSSTSSASISNHTLVEREKQADSTDTKKRPRADVYWESGPIQREEREARNAHQAKVVWLTGPSGAGKSTIGRALEKKLWEAGRQTMLLDGDQLRHGLNRDLDLSEEGRRENVRRVGEVARLFFEHGDIVICSLISPFRKDREQVRSLFPQGQYIEVAVVADKATLIERDPKGLYKKALNEEISGLTGFDGPYELPEGDAHVINTAETDLEDAVRQIVTIIENE